MVQSLKSRIFYYLVKRQLAALRRQNLPIAEFRLARESAATKLFTLGWQFQGRAAWPDRASEPTAGNGLYPWVFSSAGRWSMPF